MQYFTLSLSISDKFWVLIVKLDNKACGLKPEAVISVTLREKKMD